MDKEMIKMQEGISFLNLIDTNKILIPKIQRDYAQGRLDHKSSEIRNNFLTSIFDALTTKDSEKLLLDFIYGSTDNNVFTPLDGQQRLTTLFLIHWYFIPKSKENPLFIADGNSCYSLFSYETRISSKDFCNELVSQSLVDLLDFNKNNLHQQNDKEKIKLSTIIKNQSWFLWSWRKDPTVKAMLVMLDEIDLRAKLLEEEVYNEIWNHLENGKIVFHLLPLEQFALTDELYVKMNARGKELSPFDILKSSLEEQMQLNNVKVEFQKKWKSNIDSNWIDLFWNKLAKDNVDENVSFEKQKEIVDSVEKGFFVFLKRIIALYFAENIATFNFDLEDVSIKRLMPFEEVDVNKLNRKLLDQAIQKDVTYLFPLFSKTNFFNDKFFEYAIDVFDNLIYLDESNIKHEVSELIEDVSFSNENKTLFEAFIDDSIDYETYLLFYSVIIFCRANTTSNIINNVSLKTELNYWMRIIRNLSTLSNTFIDDIDHFHITLLAFKSWCDEVYCVSSVKSINHYIANDNIENKPRGRFMLPQFEEEKLKASLIVDPTVGNDWQKEILEIEKNGYFLGQIRFLLHWSNIDDKYDLTKFMEYKEVVNIIFETKGLNEELMLKVSHLFRNCLMANCDNYFLLNDDCFVNDTDKDRDRSWKSYLRNLEKSENIKFVIDKFFEGKCVSFIEFCKYEVANAKKTIIDWRRCFLIKPEIYNKCQQNQIYYRDKDKMEIYLLETSKKWTGLNIHSELNTYYWSLVFDDELVWKSNYFNSQTETPLTTSFKKGDNVVKVSFENFDGIRKYRVDWNFDPQEGAIFNSNTYWSIDFDSKNFFDVEILLMGILV